MSVFGPASAVAVSSSSGASRPHRGPVLVREGHNVLQEWISVTCVDHCDVRAIAIFDKHDVVDTLGHQESVNTIVDLDHIPGLCTLICSFGHRFRRKTFWADNTYAPFIQGVDGVIFTDVRKNGCREVRIYREQWMHPRIICVDGDKGQVAALLGRPVVLFDDKEDNAQQVIAAGCKNKGVVVRRGRKARKRVSGWSETPT